MEKKTKILSSVAAVLVALGVAWYFFRGDPVLADLNRERDQMMQGEATPEQRQAFREKIGTLTDDQRRAFFEQGRPQFQEMISKRMDALFSLPPEEFRREVASRADDILAARAERASRPPNAGGPPRGGGGPPGGWGRPRSQAERDTRRKQRLDFVDPKTRAQFTEMRSSINKELESRGEDPMSGRDMRALMRRR